MNTQKIIVASLALFVQVSMGSPIGSCESQAHCLHVDISDCDVTHTRRVCMSWVPSSVCPKSSNPLTDETVSHSCGGVVGQDKGLRTKTEDWEANTTICVDVRGGESAVFGVKDGRGCSDAGVYSVFGLTEPISCVGPDNVCQGGNTKECGWIVETDTCGTTPECPTSNVCEVVMPCSSDVDGLTCPCTEYKFVRG